MRISITSEKSFIEDIRPDLTIDESALNQTTKDETALAFGIAEVASIVAIIKGVGEIVKLFLDWKDRMKSNKQKLYLKTALGTVEIELSKDITAEELQSTLKTILPQ